VVGSADRRAVIGPLGLGDDQLAAEQLERLAFEHAEIDEPVVLRTGPATERVRRLRHVLTLANSSGSINVPLCMRRACSSRAGEHRDAARSPLTGVEEDNGTSIVDVTDPARPRYLAHIPGASGGSEQGGAQMARVCERQGKTYLLRTFGNAVPSSGHEVWDVTDPAKPKKASTVVSGLTTTHKNFWECDTGTAYLVSGDLAKADPLQVGASGWRTGRMTKIYDLSDPTKPVFVRDFGLAGQEPGSTGPVTIPQGVHGPIVGGNR